MHRQICIGYKAAIFFYATDASYSSNQKLNPSSISIIISLNLYKFNIDEVSPQMVGRLQGACDGCGVSYSE